MRIKLDENLPASLAIDLRESGHDVETVPEEGLQGRPDTDVWAAAQEEGRFLLTQDLDFSDIRRYTPGTHAGLLLVRLAKPGTSALREAVLQAFFARGTDDWTGCFAVATETKVRVVRPRPSTG